MFQDQQFLSFVSQLAKQFGVTDILAFDEELAAWRGSVEPRCYTQSFFLAYREKFSLGYSQTTGTPISQVTSKLASKSRSMPFSPLKQYTVPVQQVVQKVERSATGFVPSREKTDSDPKSILVKKIKSELNKLASENYDIIVPRVIEIIDNGSDSATGVDIIPEFIEIMFGKVQVDLKYLGLYSKMCTEFNSKFLTFKHLLLTHCQLEFNSPRPVIPILEGDPSSEENVSEMEEYNYDVSKWKNKRLANIKFIAELRKVCIITDNVIGMILQDLLNQSPLFPPISDNISHACELLTMVNTVIDPFLTKLHIGKLNTFMTNEKLNTIDAVKIQNVLDLVKKNNFERAAHIQIKQEPFRRRLRNR